MEVDLWSCWVSDLLDNSEASSRVFLFDDTLSLVVPTTTMFDVKEDDISRNL